ncbi:MAG TPA: membrane protein insertase YidC [Terriglobales bacterium]|nr:membrane protein insertase YidC [Terriglobales bacterium]
MHQPGPPPDPGTEKRVLLAFALTFVFLALMQPLISRYARQQQGAAPEKSAATETAAAPAPAPEAGAITAPGPVRASAERKPAAPPPVAVKQAATESETVIENDLYRIVFTNRGAQVKSWVLKKYEDDQGKPLDLVHPLAAPQYGCPLSLWTYDEGLRGRLNTALYVASESGTKTAPAAISFEYADGALQARKTFSFDHTYVVRAEVSVTQNGAAVQAYPAWPAGFGDQTSPTAYGLAAIVYQNADREERVPLKKVSGGNTIPGPFHWAGATDQYFAAVFLPDAPDSAALVTLRRTITLPKDPKNPGAGTVKEEVAGMAAGDRRGVTAGRFFVGPKSVDVLKSVRSTGPAGPNSGPDLERLVDFGKWFGWLARPLFLWLKWTQQHFVPNWGWAIVLLTIIINVALMPLRITSMKSALKMQKIQPQIKAIQEKYKKYSVRDPRRAEMNKEVADLYKQHGVNPAGGCLPLLLQMPFLIAFYSMLGVAIELRHASWIWVRDLSSPDPWHILPIGIILTMFFVQKLTPQAGMDPVQQKMMNLMMPVMIGAISWNLAAGLGLYWTIGNLLAIAQQYGINKTAFGREMREEMEKRAAKKKK